MPNSFNTTNTAWEKPAWAQTPQLKPTTKGQYIKEAGNLEAPITAAPHGDDSGPFVKPEWTGYEKPHDTKSQVKEPVPIQGEFISSEESSKESGGGDPAVSPNSQQRRGIRGMFSRKNKDGKPADVEAEKEQSPSDSKEEAATEEQAAPPVAAPNPKPPPPKYPPRSGWIVVFMEDLEAGSKKDDVRIGKFSLDFKGQRVPQAVEHFSEYYEGTDLDPATLTAECEIPLQLVTKGGKHLDSCTNLMGVVFEGAEYLSTIQTAGPECRFYIRQAHVFPVKVAHTR